MSAFERTLKYHLASYRVTFTACFASVQLQMPDAKPETLTVNPGGADVRDGSFRERRVSWGQMSDGGVQKSVRGGAASA